MCLSTAYYNEKKEENVAARYVAEIRVEGDEVLLTDVMGQEMVIQGQILFVDLTGGTVVLKAARA